ncbi:MAG: hypothetical protein ACFCU6_07445 [Balneolaceae bacterium]
MTPKKEERIRNKIAKIRKELAADKQRWGGYHHDGRGLRYIPPGLFIQIKDYKGGLRYLRWFDRTFSDDCGHPVFLFEWTLILFKTGNEKEAEKKAYETFISNTYLFDKFLDKELLKFEKWEGSNWETESLTEHFHYSKDEPEFSDFVEWLEAILTSEKFYKLANEFIEIETRLKTESVGKTRTELVSRRSNLLKNL